MEKRIITLEVIADQITKSIDRLDRSIAELRVEMARSISELRAEMRELRSDVDRKFTWLIGTQIGALSAMLGMMAKMANLI